MTGEGKGGDGRGGEESRNTRPSSIIIYSQLSRHRKPANGGSYE